MRRPVIIQHEPGEGAGSLGALLPGARPVRTFAGDAVPDEAEALVVLGGGMGVYEQERLPHLRSEIALLRRCLAADTPVLGICLGSQLLAAAAGGTVGKAATKEIGLHDVRLSPAAREDALFSAAPDEFVAFHWHGDTFTLPPHALPLASSALTPLQAFRIGRRAWGVQFHLEVDEGVLSAMVDGGARELDEAGVDGPLLFEQATRELPRMQRIAEAVFARWVALL